MNMGPGPMFTIIPTIIVIGFVVIIGIFVITLVKGTMQWANNNKQPILTVEARIVTKRTNVQTHRSGEHSTMHSDTEYYLTFEVDSGDRMEFQVTGEESGLLVEGDQGRLSFQGTRYKGFQRYGSTQMVRD